LKKVYKALSCPNPLKKKPTNFAEKVSIYTA